MSVKPQKLRKSRALDDKADTNIAPVHKSSKNKESSSDQITEVLSESSSASNRTYIKEDNNRDDCDGENNPTSVSREISVDGESQITSKIYCLIEAEMKREAKHSTFSDSRPQSLSFYEEEKIPEELSGNLELLSPEERKHYKRRKDYAQMDTEERNMYNSIHDNEDIMSNSLKKSKSRKKKHGGDGEMGMGDSREMMIPKEKRKTKKKKHENSPMSKARKHKKHETDGFGSRNDITMALEDLQDDVFENTLEVFAPPVEKAVRKSPRKSDKVYVQKKNKFELMSNGGAVETNLETHPIRQPFGKTPNYPLEYAISAQRWWRKFTTFCHGLLGGLGFAHFVYISANKFSTEPETLRNYATYSETYCILFYILCVLCLVSVFDKYDIAHLNYTNLKELIRTRKSCFVILLYMITLIVHLVTLSKDDKIAMVSDDYKYVFNITTNDLRVWNSLSFTRGLLAFISWFFVSLSSPEDYLTLHLSSMETHTIVINGA